MNKPQNKPTYPLSQSKGLKIALLNINSLKKHIDELRIAAPDLALDILAINETKLDKTYSDGQLMIEGYNLIRRDRDSRGGGVCFYVRDSINFARKSELEDDNLELLALEIKNPNSLPFLVLTWYRPPNFDLQYFDNFRNLLQNIDNKYDEIFILGDLNCNLLANPLGSHTSCLKDLLDEFQMEQIIKEPTRVTENHSSLIDHIITNAKHKIIKSGVYPMSISDHNLVYLIRKQGIPRGNPRIIETRNFKRFNQKKFINEIAAAQWPDTTGLNDVNEFWVTWKNAFVNIVDKHAPRIRLKIRNKPSPWITPEIKSKMHERDFLKKKASQTNLAQDWSKYKKCKNSTNKQVAKTKKKYYRDQIAKFSDNSRKTWKTLNDIRGKKSKSTEIREIKESPSVAKLTTDSNQIAEVLNIHFSEIASKLASKIDNNVNMSINTDPLCFIRPVNSVFTFVMINPERVFKLLQTLDVSKAIGLDGIPNNLLKIAAPYIYRSLTNLFNLSLKTNTFPCEFKIAKVCPIFKSGDRDDANNYRPISITPTIARIFEKVIFEQLTEYLNHNNLIDVHQSGFRSIHSTLTALLDLTNDWSFNIDRKMINGAVFLDLQKAFDTVDHNVLLMKLKRYGFDPDSTKWFSSFLTNRQQRCAANGTLSTTRSLTHGVPQGAILGSVLFLIYINDLPNCLDYSTPRLYADDTTLTFSDCDTPALKNQMKSDLDQVALWLRANKLTLNVLKSEFMLIGSRQRLSTNDTVSMNLAIDGVPLKRCNETKCLGVIIDEHLNWKSQIESIIKKVTIGLCTLKSIKSLINRDNMIKVYKATIEPYFDYCSLVWDGIDATLTNKLQILHNRAARIITGSPYLTVRTNDMFKQLNWKKLYQRRLKQKAIMMFKVVNGLAPPYLIDMFSKKQSSKTYGLRGSIKDLQLPKVRTDYYKTSFAFTGAKLWNSLPNRIKEQETLKSFNKELEKYDFQ